ncbi:hypothetical protein COOONC_20883, partial [Cooperia oncophora]
LAKNSLNLSEHGEVEVFEDEDYGCETADEIGEFEKTEEVAVNATGGEVESITSTDLEETEGDILSSDTDDEAEESSEDDDDSNEENEEGDEFEEVEEDEDVIQTMPMSGLNGVKRRAQEEAQGR